MQFSLLNLFHEGSRETTPTHQESPTKTSDAACRAIKESAVATVAVKRRTVKPSNQSRKRQPIEKETYKTGLSIICVERQIETTISRRIYSCRIIISKKSINASHFRVLGCNRTSNNGDEEDDNISTA
jgi:hypothetical protein